ncbi:MAG: valine--tRNA ligase [Christensenellaceae bacterium]|jgi:valyl-tRNA synthetase|nr:valine--tRNA ligase [Christensenellaceae bacterium]
MEKNFDFERAEREINARWLERETFKANNKSDKAPYTVIMPPPNITARLHIGHAFNATIEDAIIRFKRMQGFEALLLPGADHAAIATEVKVVEELRKQGIEKASLTREQFSVYIETWYQKYLGEICEQFKGLGLSADWSRFSFTMDDNNKAHVRRAFKKLYDEGYIYKGTRMVNWCPVCETALSDAEVEFEEMQRSLYEIKYGDLVVATTRPETMFGDTAVAVNPSDKRYAKLVGSFVEIPLTNKKIPIIADESVDIKFGTGALKITPAHDHNDNAVGIKHNLEAVCVIDQKGKMCGDAPIKYHGMTALEARKVVVADLKAAGLLVSVKPHSSNVGTCYRCHNLVEPQISSQWFMKMKELAQPAIDCLNKGLNLYPKKFEKIYLNWLNNIKDWCISRQLWSGHKIPVFECGECRKRFASEFERPICSCGGKCSQDNDVLDTWFSSALWPFSTLGARGNSDDFKKFYPTQTMATAYEIIFFWVIRMVFSGLYHTEKLPFENVVLHGLVRDSKGRKMSKSLGNGIDPMVIIKEFGADVLRFSLLSGTKLDRDPRYSTEKAILTRNFINKIWNASKFIEAYALGAEISDLKIDFAKLGAADKWILTQLKKVIKDTTARFEKFDIGVACDYLERFFWGDVCDVYLESAKVSADKKQTARILLFVLNNFLRLLHPIMPFATTTLYKEFFDIEDVAFEPFPNAEEIKGNFAKEARLFEGYIALIKYLRDAKKKDNALKTANVFSSDLIDGANIAIIEKLSAVKIELEKIAKPDAVVSEFKILLGVDETKKRAEIAKKIDELKFEIARSEKMLANPAFVSKAPAALIKAEQEKLARNESLLKSLIN